MKLNKIALSLAVFVMSTSAFAQDANVEPTAVVSPFFLSASAGVSISDQSDYSLDQHGNDSSFTTKLKAGYNIDQNLNVFTSYHHINDVDGNDINLGTIGVGISIPMTDRIGIDVAGGAVLVAGGQFTGMGSIDLTYKLTSNLALIGGYDYFQNIHVNNDQTDISNFNVGIKYSFGTTAPVVVLEPVVVPEPVIPVIMAKEITQDMNIYFGVNKSTLSNEAKSKLQQFIADTNVMTDIIIVGRTDKSGNNKINDPLSYKRALTVKNYLKTHGLNKTTFFIESFGSHNPLSINSAVHSDVERSVVVKRSVISLF